MTTPNFDTSGFDKTGFDVVYPSTSTYPISQTTQNPYPVKVVDSSCNYLAIVFSYQYLGWTRRLYEPDGFTLELNTKTTYSDKFVLGNYLGFKDNKRFIGYIEDINYVQDKLTNKLTITGRDPTGLFANRIALHNTTTGTGYDDQSGNAETVISHYINKNCIDASDNSRNLSNLVLLTDEGRGNEVSYSARFDYISDIVSDLANSGELGFQTSYNPIDCTVELDFIEGTDHSYTSSDPVVFKNDFKNIISLDISKSAVGNVNLAYVGDSGSDAARSLDEVFVSSEPSGNDRIELFVDGSSTTTTAERTTLGESAIIENQTQTSVSAEIKADNSAFVYGTDYDLGDTVSLEFEDTVYDLKIVEVLLEFDSDNYKKVTLTLGKPLRSFVKQTKKDTRATAQEKK